MRVRCHVATLTQAQPRLGKAITSPTTIDIPITAIADRSFMVPSLFRVGSVTAAGGRHVKDASLHTAGSNDKVQRIEIIVFGFWSPSPFSTPSDTSSSTTAIDGSETRT